jgi:hypothetical protein
MRAGGCARTCDVARLDRHRGRGVGRRRRRPGDNVARELKNSICFLEGRESFDRRHMLVVWRFVWRWTKDATQTALRQLGGYRVTHMDSQEITR